MKNSEYSIMEWEIYKDDDEEWAVLITYPDTTELFEIVTELPNVLGPVRYGFTIKIKGSCCKVPQGINWTKVLISFEREQDFSKFLHWLPEKS